MTDAPRVFPARRTRVGSDTIARALPQRALRTVGGWCFADVFTPGVGTRPSPGIGGVGPHPHSGLHTVTWLVSGSLHHTDSLGSSAIIRPGEVNLMTAGHGVTHAETAEDPTDAPTGAQLWLAQPDRTRHGPARFAHHDDLPQLRDDKDLSFTLIVGTWQELSSPAVVDRDALCLAVSARHGGRTSLTVDAGHEHGVLVLNGNATIETASGAPLTLAPGDIGHLPIGADHITLHPGPGTDLLILGGPPEREHLHMWWNFVMRNRTEAADAATAWNAGDRRFGPLPPSPFAPIPAPIPP